MHLLDKLTDLSYNREYAMVKGTVLSTKCTKGGNS